MKFWSWESIPSSVTVPSNVKHITRVNMGLLTRTPEEEANRWVAAIKKDDPTSSDDLCLLPQNITGYWKRGANSSKPHLWHHPNDAVNGVSYTGFFDEGVAWCRHRTLSVFGLLAEKLKHLGLPFPSRIHCDNEEKPSMRNGGKAITGYMSMLEDPRWRKAMLGTQRPWFYTMRGTPNPVGTSVGVAANLAWKYVYGWHLAEQVEMAQDMAVYSPMRLVFPGVKCSNYGTSDRYDGEGKPAQFDDPRKGIQVMRSSYGDISAPVLYYLGAPKTDEWDDKEFSTWCFRAQHKLRGACNSFGGVQPVAPWIFPPGQGFMTPELFWSMVGMIRDFGCEEILLWSNAGATDWDTLASVANAFS